MGFLTRIGQFGRSLASRIGSLTFSNALNRIGQTASIAHKVAHAIDFGTGGGLTQASNSVLGKPLTSALKGAVSYTARAYDNSLMARAAMGVPTSQDGPQTSGRLKVA